MNCIFFAAWLVAVSLLVFVYLNGESGIYAQQQLEKDIAQQNEVNKVLQARNRIIFAEMEDLKNGLDVVEEYARLDLGLIKKNETFVQINAAKEKALPTEFRNQEEVDIAPMVEEIAPEMTGQ